MDDRPDVLDTLAVAFGMSCLLLLVVSASGFVHTQYPVTMFVVASAIGMLGVVGLLLNMRAAKKAKDPGLYGALMVACVAGIAASAYAMYVIGGKYMGDITREN
jgi:hypothetical protein